MRTFIAIEVPETIKRALAEMQRALKDIGADAGWTNPDGIHLTLKFLGEIDPGLLPEVAGCCRAAVSGATPFTMTLDGTGVFPNFRNPRVLWAGLKEESGMLQALQLRLEDELSAIGFKPEDKPFNPHLTICRIRSLKKSRELLARAEMYDLPEISFEVRDIRVFKSELSPAGARYTELVKEEIRRRPPINGHS